MFVFSSVPVSLFVPMSMNEDDLVYPVSILSTGI